MSALSPQVRPPQAPLLGEGITLPWLAWPVCDNLRVCGVFSRASRAGRGERGEGEGERGWVGVGGWGGTWVDTGGHVRCGSWCVWVRVDTGGTVHTGDG